MAYLWPNTESPARGEAFGDPNWGADICWVSPFPGGVGV